ncbi:MAG: hypothetical protein OJF61_000641 [Rhodanobacteraceae bacterium]|jgi:hypothetical protein|nr:MAG: hypothetical protein OJF61_000641 [Rhodanobacteraceae bacterium]
MIPNAMNLPEPFALSVAAEGREVEAHRPSTSPLRGYAQDERKWVP